jgi:hypothetical protein
MTTKEMRRAICRPGYWFVNTARLGEAPNWVEQVLPHEQKYLFGYVPSDLLAKQYK